VARAVLRTFLSHLADGELYVAASELVLSELVTNAILHGRTAESDKKICVRFKGLPGLLRVEVHDASSTLPTMSTARLDDESGRGLALVELLALRWGCGPRDGVGKQVWAEIGPAERDGLPGSGL
jgi:anti-sigma regulatory factor (Ser/Thr protein kinase)